MNIYHHNSKKDGFTLIELLVVIAIIGILSSIAFASLNSARVKARDARRISDLKQIQLALELYYGTNNSYPKYTGTSWRSECAGWGGLTPDNVIPGLTPTYLPTFPSDPKLNKSGNKYCYLYRSNGTDYALLHIGGLEEIDYSRQSTFIDPRRDGGSDPCTVDGTDIRAWKISSAGGRCW